MGCLWKLLKVLIAILVLLVLFSLLLPTEWKVERSVLIQGLPAGIFPYLNDLKRWPEWGPWWEKDPEMETLFSQPSAGKGARMTWSSARLGNGWLAIEESDPTRGIRYRLEMEGGFGANGEIRMEALEGGTRVVWRDTGEMGEGLFWRTLGKYAGLLSGLIMGPTFEEGLERLKEQVEG